MGGDYHPRAWPPMMQVRWQGAVQDAGRVSLLEVQARRSMRQCVARQSKEVP